MDFAKNLRAYRKLNNLSQKELSIKLECSQSIICDYEKGNSEPSLFMLSKLAKYFDTTIDTLISGNDLELDDEKLLPISCGAQQHSIDYLILAELKTCQNQRNISCPETEDDQLEDREEDNYLPSSYSSRNRHGQGSHFGDTDPSHFKYCSHYFNNSNFAAPDINIKDAPPQHKRSLLMRKIAKMDNAELNAVVDFLSSRSKTSK